jgi:hypothetical protein
MHLKALVWPLPSGRVLVSYVQSSGFDPQLCGRKKGRKEERKHWSEKRFSHFIRLLKGFRTQEVKNTDL